MKRFVLAVLLAAAVFSVATAAFPAHSQASTTPLKMGTIPNADLNTVGIQFKPAFRYVTCGKIAQVPCSNPSEIPVFCDTWLLRQAIDAGRIPRGSTVMFDFEHWTATPAYQQADPPKYLIRAGIVARRHGINLIITVNFPGWQNDLAYLAAAAPYAGEISVQNQGASGYPARYLASTKDAIRAIRAQSKTVPIWMGLATDPGGHPVSSYMDLVKDWRETVGLVSGYFMNAADWPGHPGCAPTGCPAIGHAFLQAIGA